MLVAQHVPGRIRLQLSYQVHEMLPGASIGLHLCLVYIYQAASYFIRGSARTVVIALVGIIKLRLRYLQQQVMTAIRIDTL